MCVFITSPLTIPPLFLPGGDLSTDVCGQNCSIFLAVDHSDNHVVYTENPSQTQASHACPPEERVL